MHVFSDGAEFYEYDEVLAIGSLFAILRSRKESGENEFIFCIEDDENYFVEKTYASLDDAKFSDFNCHHLWENDFNHTKKKAEVVFALDK